jgi:hypothetical protein
LILTTGFLSCISRTEKTDVTISKSTNSKIKYHKLQKLFVVGDFEGKGKQDTIFQHNFSRLTKTEIEYAADPFQNEWETVIKWFYDHDADLYLTMNRNNQQALHLGTAQGLYCLINIGDNNADGRDEIALVIDYLDISSINSCKIYSLCKDKWTLLKQFKVHEEAFFFENNKALIFDNIKGYLEKQNNKWVFKDYLEDSDNQEKQAEKMKMLYLDKCR